MTSGNARHEPVNRLIWVTCGLFVWPLLFVGAPGNLANMRNWHLLLLAFCAIGVFVKRLHVNEILQVIVSERQWHWLTGLSLFSTLAAAGLHFYAFRVNGMDFSIFDWMLYNSNHRNFMTSPVCNHCNHFGVHPSYIMLPLVPLHRLFESPIFLQVVQAVSIWASQFPLRRLAERAGLPSILSFFVVVAFLVNSWTGSILNHGFHFEVFFLPLGFFLILSWLTHRRILFYVTLLFFLSIKEDAVLYASTFIVGSVLTGDRRKWDAFAVLLLCLAVGLLNLRLAQPYFLGLSGDVQPVYVTRFWGKYGGNKLDIFWGMLQHPGWVLGDVLGAGWVSLLGSMLYLPFLSLHASITFLPFFLLNGTASSGDQQLRDFAFYYSSPFLPFAFFGLVASWQRLARYAAQFWPNWSFGADKIMGSAILLFALNTGGYQKFPAPRLDVLRDIQDFKHEFGRDGRHFCVQLALFPHLPYQWDLNVLEPGCFERDGAIILAHPDLDPNPYSEGDLKSMIQLATEASRYPSGLVVLRSRRD